MAVVAVDATLVVGVPGPSDWPDAVVNAFDAVPRPLDLMLGVGTEEDGLVHAMSYRCFFPSVTPNASPRTAPKIISRIRTPNNRFLHEWPRGLDDAATPS